MAPINGFGLLEMREWVQGICSTQRPFLAILLLVYSSAPLFLPSSLAKAETGRNISHSSQTLQSEFTQNHLPHYRRFDVSLSAQTHIAPSASSQILIEADKLSAQWNADSWRKAIRKYKVALVAITTSEAWPKRVRTLLSIGEVYLALSEPQQALQNFEQAYGIHRGSKSHSIDEVDALNDLANANLLLGDNQKALQYCRESAGLGRSLGYLKGEAQAIEIRGQVKYSMGDLTGSLETYAEALPKFLESHDLAGQAQTLLDFGYTYSDLSESEKALRAYQQALPLFRAVSNPRGEALTLTAMGHVYSKVGEKQRALNLYNQSIVLLKPIEDLVATAFNFDGLGYLHSELGDKEVALEQYETTLALFRKAKYRYGEVGTLWKIGEIYVFKEDYETALKYLKESLSISKTIGDPRMESIPVGLIGRVNERLGNKAIALDSYQRELELNRTGKDRREEAYTLASIGRVYQSLGDTQKALNHYYLALTLNRETGDRFGESSTLYRIANVERDIGSLDEAKTNSDRSIALIESLRTQVASHDLRSSYVASVHQYYELNIDILMDLHKLRPSERFDKAALEASESSRARTLLETLAEANADIRQGVNYQLLERERALQRQLDANAQRQLKLGGRSARNEALSLEHEIHTLTAEYQDVEGQIRASSPRYSALTQPIPLKLNQIQQLLDSETLFLEYSLGERRSFAWILTRESIWSFELPERAKIESAARNLYQVLTAPNGAGLEQADKRGQSSTRKGETDYAIAARRLSKMVLDPLAAFLDKKRLVVIAEGALQYVPFAALPAPPFSSTQGVNALASAQLGDEISPLIVDHEIITLPSASVLAVQRQQIARRLPAPNAVAVLADPVFDRSDPRVSTRVLAEPRIGRGSSRSSAPSFSPSSAVARALRDIGFSANGEIPRLVFSRREGEEVFAAAPAGQSMKALDFSANRATAMSSELARYRIIHIATHGLLNSEHPELSGILLSMVDEKGRPVDGFLQLHEIYNLNLPADLVVLSACQTALGKDIRGEGLVGLTRGFMYAGAARVIASLWKVDDVATSELMAQFYKEMFTNGERPAAALRAAQIRLFQQKRWRSPYYWAGFVLQGEWK